MTHDDLSRAVCAEHRALESDASLHATRKRLMDLREELDAAQAEIKRLRDGQYTMLEYLLGLGTLGACAEVDASNERAAALGRAVSDAVIECMRSVTRD